MVYSHLSSKFHTYSLFVSVKLLNECERFLIQTKTKCLSEIFALVMKLVKLKIHTRAKIAKIGSLVAVIDGKRA